MLRQTIALFRYQLLGIINIRVGMILLIILLAGVLSNRFIAELAILNSNNIALAGLADFMRYGMMLVMVVTVCHQITQDYDLLLFERLLAMPINRMQYVLAQLMVVVVFAVVLTLPVLILMLTMGAADKAIYWSAALILELILVGQFATLASLSLEKLPAAVLFSLTIILLAKAAPLIELILLQSSAAYQGEVTFQWADTIFSGVQYILPGLNAFAQNNLLFGMEGTLGSALLSQIKTVLGYIVFIEFIILLDFYRKEFSRT